MDDQAQLAIQYVNDSFKQMIALSTGVLTLEITLLKDVIENLTSSAYFALGASWLAFLVALLAGIWGMLAITGSLGRSQAISADSIYNRNIAIPAKLQVISFAFGMISTVVFGIAMLAGRAGA